MGSASCPFCRLKASGRTIVAESKKFIAVRDDYPVSKGHTLLIPKRHLHSLPELSEEDVVDLYRLLKKVKDRLEDEFEPDGFNIGVNEGKAAGQTVFHLHVHVIPRYIDDVDHPEGGIRNIVSSHVRYPETG